MSELIDRTFWERLKLFVQNVQVNDQMSEEEQGYILRTARRNIEAQMKVNKISSSAVLAVSLPSGLDIVSKSKEYEGGTEIKDRYRRIGFQDGMETMKTIIELQIGRGNDR